MNKKTTFALADDEILIRKGIRNMIEQENHFKVIFEASNGLELMDYLESKATKPDVIITDIKMPDLNGIDATKRIATQFPKIKIIALSSYDSPIFVKNMLEVGAVCHISKSVAPDELLEKINIVIENGFYFKESVLESMYNQIDKEKTFFDSDFFTKRELEVLKLICKQLSATEIAERLFISSRTVDGHRNSLLLKTESKNIIGLVIFAIQNNFFDPEIDLL